MRNIVSKIKELWDKKHTVYLHVIRQRQERMEEKNRTPGPPGKKRIYTHKK